MCNIIMYRYIGKEIKIAKTFIIGFIARENIEVQEVYSLVLKIFKFVYNIFGYIKSILVIADAKYNNIIVLWKIIKNKFKNHRNKNKYVVR